MMPPPLALACGCPCCRRRPRRAGSPSPGLGGGPAPGLLDEIVIGAMVLGAWALRSGERAGSVLLVLLLLGGGVCGEAGVTGVKGLFKPLSISAVIVLRTSVAVSRGRAVWAGPAASALPSAGLLSVTGAPARVWGCLAGAGAWARALEGAASSAKAARAFRFDCASDRLLAAASGVLPSPATMEATWL